MQNVGRPWEGPENHEPDAKDLQTSSVFSNTSRSLRNRRKFLHVTGERRQTLSKREGQVTREGKIAKGKFFALVLASVPLKNAKKYACSAG